MNSSIQKIYIKAIFIWLSVVLFYFYQFFIRVYPSVLSNELMQFFDISATSLGTLVGSYYLVYTLAQIPMGLFLDKYGTKIVTALSIIICSLGSFMFICSTNYYIAMLGRILTGIGSACAFCSCLKIANIWFPKEKVGLITTITVSLGVIGPIFGVPVFASLLKTHDWQQILYFISGIGLILFIYTIIFVQDSPDGHKEVHIETNPVNFITAFKTILSNKNFYFMFVYGFCTYAPVSSFSDMWGVPFLQSLYPQMSITDIAVLTNSLYMGMIFGPILSLLTNKYGEINIMIISSIAMSICFGFVVLCDAMSYYSLYSCIFITGFFTTGQLFLYPIAYRTIPSNLSGVISAFINSAGMLSGSLLQPILGYIADIFWDGTIINNTHIYNTHCYKAGFSLVIILLIISIFVPKFIKEERNNIV